jgi:hypothetical protein
MRDHHIPRDDQFDSADDIGDPFAGAEEEPDPAVARGEKITTIRSRVTAAIAASQRTARRSKGENVDGDAAAAADEGHETVDEIVFDHETISFLADLKRVDRGQFEKLRRWLRNPGGISMGALDETLKTSGGYGGSKEPSDTEIAMNIARDECCLFHAPDGTAFSDTTVSDRVVTMPILSRDFADWLNVRFLEKAGRPIHAPSLKTVTDNLSSIARAEGQERAVFIRVGSHDGKIYVDLGGKDWTFIEIDARDWREVKADDVDVRFRRGSGQMELSFPVVGGSINDLRAFMNLASEDDFIQLVSWLLGTLRTGVPCPMLVLSGEQGTAKSTTAEMLKMLVDRCKMLSRAMVRDEQELAIAMRHTHVVNFDNVSHISAAISDALCRSVTGGGFAARALYTNDEESQFFESRPIILNGIGTLATRPDLVERSIIVTLEPIPDDQRRSKSDLMTAFHEASPRILGALLDAAAVGLREIDSVHLAEQPRMADFAKWITACEPGLGWEPGMALRAYEAGREAAVATTLEADIVALAVRKFMDKRPQWEGTATDLLQVLSVGQDVNTIHNRAWPTAPNALSNKLERLAPTLRKVGLEIVRREVGHANVKVVQIVNTRHRHDAGTSGGGQHNDNARQPPWRRNDAAGDEQ